MRLRTDKAAHEKLAARPERVVILDPDALTQLDHVATQSSLALEIGCGKGGFIKELAPHFPKTHFFAFEKFETILVKALLKYDQSPSPNITYVSGDATHLAACFKPLSIEDIYLNFSDPWPKARHEKRRLTYPTQLTHYHQLLKADGTLHLKTDNRSFFYYSLIALQANGFAITDSTTDLSHSDWFNVPTEFEARYTPTTPIHALKARKQV